MSVTDNRTHFQDCENSTEIAGQSTMGVTTNSSLSGTVLEGTNALGFQCDDAQEYLLYDLNAAGGTINLDMSDMTIYLNVKHNLGETFANLGGQIALCDEADAGGGDVIGYNVNGSDVSGFPYLYRYAGIKLDVSVIVASPGTDDVDYYTYSGTEAGLDHTSINQIGYAEFNIVKAVSSALNAWMDGIYYIANGSYAASIIGGTVGTPETMVDVAADDVSAGLVMFNNPKGTEYGFFAPTEWGAATGDTYFTSTGEQWYFIGDNQGGHAVGATHFPMRLLGGTGTNSWAITSTAMVNTGTKVQFDLSDSNFDTATMNGCSLISFGTIELPNAGTAKTTLNCIFSDCDIVTSNGGDMTGSSIITPNISANESGLVWNLSQDPNGELDNMTFTKTSGLAHHAIEFGTAIPDAADYTLTGCNFGTDFSATEDGSVGDETFHFLDTTGSITLNLVSCTGNFGYRTEGVGVTIVADPVTTSVTVKDNTGAPLLGARVILEASSAAGDLPYLENPVSITRSGTTATADHTGHGIPDGKKVVIRGATDTLYNGVFVISVTDVDTYTYTMGGTPAASPASGTITASGVILEGTTDSSGLITDSRTITLAQPVIGRISKGTSSPYFKDSPLSGEVDNTDGLSLSAQLILDE